MNEGSKYPITGDDNYAIECRSDFSANFGVGMSGERDLVVHSYSNINTASYCCANQPCFKLPAAVGGENKASSINGGKYCF